MQKKMKWEEEESKKKVTLGEEYLRRFEKNEGESAYEARAIIQQYGLDTFSPELEDIIDRHKEYAKEYYIWIVSQDIGHFEAKKINFVVRKTVPFPKWETILLHYTNATNELRIKWVLPTKEGGEAMLKNPEGWDSLIIKSIREKLPFLRFQESEILSGRVKTQAQKAGVLTQVASHEARK